MNLVDLKDGNSAKISFVNADDEMLERLYSFGFFVGKKITRVKSGPSNSTIAVELDRSCVILRRDEAAKIEISQI